jgi:hypothetical protein
MHRSDSHSVLVDSSLSMWQCIKKSQLRRLCLSNLPDGLYPSTLSLNFRQLIESVECILSAHLHHRGLRIITASIAFGRDVLWQYDTVHSGVYGGNWSGFGMSKL